MSFLRKCWKMRMGSLLGLLKLEDPDNVSLDSKTAKAMYSTPGVTGRERLWYMFTVNDYGEMSCELQTVYQATFLSGFFGLVCGGFMQSRVAYLDFLENNQATAFKTHWEAKKKLQDYVTISFAKGGFRWGWRLALFTGTYVLISTTISVYRNKSSVLEYSVAGLTTGALYKCNLGLRGIVVGSGLGLVLGTVTGSMTIGLLKLTNTSMQDVRFWQYKWKESRLNQERSVIKSIRDEEEMALAKIHDQQVGEKGKNLDSIPLTPAEGNQ